MFKKLILTFGLLSFSLSVCAEGYYGLSYSRVDFDGVEPTALEFKIGSQIEDTIALEGRFAIALGKDSETLLMKN
ncbi:MAG: hypothetical protein ACI845_000399 [Gammaproteobacteria bacterium]|jgi:hypothetical protein